MRFKYSLLASAMLGLSTSAVYAQETDVPPAEEDEVEIIDVRGTRADLYNAQNIKRFSETVVDALDASDIGGFPDRSVLEAISRLPGVTMGRFAAPNDPDHFGTEGSGLVIRGLTQVRSEFNGRDSFTANSGRGLSFQDVPPELMGSVEVFKNSTADMIEGGISGTVNLVTRKPFDNDGQMIAFSVDATYADFIDAVTPTFSALYSNTYTNDNGKFGVLFNVSHSELEAQSDGAMVGQYQPQNLIGDGSLFVPEAARLTRKRDDRTRSGAAAVIQWQSPDRTIKATGEYIRSDSQLAWTENAVEMDDGDNQNNLLPVEGTEFDFDSNGYFERGIITSTAGWRGNEGDRTPGGIFGTNHVLQARYRDEQSLVEDLSLNVQYTPNDTWAFNADVQYVDGTNDIIDFSVMGATDAVVGLDVSGSGKPKIDYYDPNFNGEAGYARDSNHFTDPNTTFFRSAMDHVSQNEGNEIATRLDAKYTFDDGAIESVQFGVRYAKRDQTTRQSTYNWGVLSEAWTGVTWFDSELGSQVPQEIVSFDNFGRGGILDVDGGNQFLFPAMSIAQNYRNAGSVLGPISNGWQPLAQRDGVIEGTDFLPNEINETTETNTAAYLKFNFTGELGDMDYSGNFGVRYVKLENETEGFVVFPDNTIDGPTDNDLLLPADQRAFGDAGSFETTSTDDYNKLLPSFNVKLNLTDELLMRFSFSEAIALPELGLLRNYVSIQEQDRVTVVGPDIDGDGQPDPISSEIGRYTAESGNPFLKPMESTNYDLTLEWYFAPVGSLTASLFYKDLKNYFISGTRNQEFTNNGATQTVEVASPLNGDEGKIQGFELAYQQFFDTLPAPFDGIGVQANYTYVDEEGSPNAGLSSDNSNPNANANFAFEGLPLEGLSQDNYNLVLLYEKYGWNARMAYNWRSAYLLTTQDVITTLPIFNEDIGFLDASVFYDVTENLKIGLQGSNLTDETTRTAMQVDQEGNRRLRGAFVNDRRISFIVRGVF
ncbi:TonB-dependent receptor [Alteromonas sp. SM 2104]|nr:TonB-dependent receptor [Alteromonas oceanisediminis]